MTLQRVHAIFIFKSVVIAREGLFKLGVLLTLPPLFLVDMIHAIDEAFDS
jgi:hypothetical protein